MALCGRDYEDEEAYLGALLVAEFLGNFRALVRGLSGGKKGTK